VHDTTALHFGDLAKGQPEVSGADTELAGDAGQRAADGDGGTPPQLGGLVVEHHLGVVVVAVQTQRRADDVFAVGVDARAAQVHAVRAQAFVAAGPAGDRLAGLAGAAGVHVAERGATRVTNTAGWALTVAGMPLPPTSPARMSWYASRRYTSAHEGQTEARRLPHALYSTPSGMVAVSVCDSSCPVRAWTVSVSPASRMGRVQPTAGVMWRSQSK
jgi:hypothetical protein